jgi:hypothetical protein
MRARKWCGSVSRAVLVLAFLCPANSAPAQSPADETVLRPESFHHYFVEFENDEREMLGKAPALPWDWFVKNIPWLDVPDKELEKTYYFRWYSFQKHIRETRDGYVISEFLDDVPWAGKLNTIDCAAGHHIREARWLRDPAYASDYTRFWFGPDGEPRRYSFWAADSVYQLYLATGNRDLAISLLPALERNFEAWNETHRDANGLYWQIDDRDGMEDSISGNGYRPTINSYQYGDSVAVAKIARLAGQKKVAESYRKQADQLRAKIEQRLWNPKDEFYETAAQHSREGWSGGRELIGYIPWYFDIPPPDRDIAWKQLFEPDGFAGKYGPTTAERRNPRFEYKVQHECLWNGPSWPFATTQTLVALANLLNGPEQHVMTSGDYTRLLTTYALSQRIRLPSGKVIPWIDEDLDADTGSWIARNILIALHQPPENRGRYYNHSGFADLVITGLIGIRPSADDTLVIHPLVQSDQWDYFALDGLPYHRHLLTVFYDRDGSRYHRGAGLQVLLDGRQVTRASRLQTLKVQMPVEDH